MLACYGLEREVSQVTAGRHVCVCSNGQLLCIWDVGV